MAELSNAVGEEGISSWLIRRQCEQTVGRKKRNAIRSVPIKAGDDGDSPPLHLDKLGFRDLNTSPLGQRQREDFTRGNVPGIIGLGKFRNGKPAVGQRNGGFWPSAPKR